MHGVVRGVFDPATPCELPQAARQSAGASGGRALKAGCGLGCERSMLSGDSGLNDAGSSFAFLSHYGPLYLRLAVVAERALALPPLNEQRRIVEKLDAVFEKSRAAKARLERLPALLEKLKRSILAAAFRGDLTKDWRAAHPDVEPASVLLERIRAERRRRWEEGLRAKGKDPKKATYEEPAPVDVAGLPELPDGWAWARLEELAADEPRAMVDGPFGSNLKTDDYVDAGVRVVRLGNIGDGMFLDEDRSFVTNEKAASLASHGVRSGDIVVAALAEPVGRACMFPDGVGAGIVKADCVRIRAHSAVLAEYVMHAVNEPGTRKRIELTAHGIGRLRINLGELRSIVVPVAPRSEQAEVLRRVATALRQSHGLVGRRGRMVARYSALEQAALAKAFRGELVAQDPTDEPASALLDRIRAARADEPQRGRRGRPARPADPELFAAKPAAPRATNGHGAEGAEGAPVDLVVAAFQLAPRLTATSIGSTTGLDAASVKKALKALVDGGQVRVEGKARGTAYVWSR